MSVRHGTFETSLGELLLIAEGESLAGLYYPQPKHPPKPGDIGENLGPEPADATLNGAARQLREYLAGERTSFDIPLAPRGDEFSQRVWALLLEIPFGETTTYGKIARELGNASYAQPVGRAVGHNPIMVLIPCHRVLGSDGSLTGYAGGLDRKRTLLKIEEPTAELAGRLF